jgi:hypothetical protein
VRRGWKKKRKKRKKHIDDYEFSLSLSSMSLFNIFHFSFPQHEAAVLARPASQLQPSHQDCQNSCDESASPRQEQSIASSSSSLSSTPPSTPTKGNGHGGYPPLRVGEDSVRHVTEGIVALVDPIRNEDQIKRVIDGVEWFGRTVKVFCWSPHVNAARPVQNKKNKN